MRLIVYAACVAGLAMLAASARAEPVQGHADVEAVSVGPQDQKTDIFFNARFVAAVDGRPAESDLWIRVQGTRFGQTGVDRVQRLLTAAIMGRNRLFIVYDNEGANLIAIRLEK